MNFEKITNDALAGKGVMGLPDTPELSSEEMQAKFDEISKAVIIPAFNLLVDALTTAFSDVYTKEQVAQLIGEKLTQMTAGDMAMYKYDSNEDGKVNSADDADKLGGHTPDYYAKDSEVMKKSNFEFDEATGTLNIWLKE